MTARLALIGLNYCQPFLISGLIDYVGEEGSNKNDGYGLIGAFALVFLLKGVGNLSTTFFCVNMHLTRSFLGPQRHL